jgi:putative ABC transport system permease protein
MESILHDLRFGLRMLIKSPVFTLIAVLTLGLGIGANTALFSVVNGVLLNPLPFPDPGQLVTLHESKPNFDRGSISYPNFQDWQRNNRSFSAFAISRSYAFSLTGSGDPEQVGAEFVSSEFFRILGVKPVLGRDFAAGEDRVGGAPLVMISEGFWQRKFGGTADILGKSITLDAKSYTVIGIIPAQFHLQIPAFRERDVYAPIGQWTNPLLQNRGAGLGIHGIARLKPAVTIEQAQADMNSVSHALAEAYPDTNKGIGASLVPLRREIVGRVQPLLLALLGAVSFVLLIACVNVANLLLARSTARTREFAIRFSLGAERWRVTRQLLVESVMIGLAGGSLGLLLAAWGTRAALGVLPSALPRAEEIQVDTHVLVFTIGLSILTGILFGLAPSLRLSLRNLHETLQEGGRGLSGARHRTQSVFVVVEMAMALVLLTGAGLMIRTMIRLGGVDPGFDSHHVLNFGVSLPPQLSNASPDTSRAALRELHERLATTPGVAAVSLSWESLPLAGDDERLFWLEGQPKPTSESDMNWALHYVVEPDYLSVMHIPLMQGRFFTAHDDEHASPVIVVDDVFAKKYFPGQNAVGRRINLNGGAMPVEIVGVVGHVKQWGLDLDDVQPLRAQLYVPGMQMPDSYISNSGTGVGVLVRSPLPVSELLTAIRHTSSQMSNQQVIYGVQTMDQLIGESVASRRFAMILFGAFAAVALILASVGIYGVISYLVGQRTHEIGVRMALGARPSDIMRLIVGRGGRMALAGVGLGLIAAFALSRLMTGLLYGVGSNDPLTLLSVAVLLTSVALVASYIPARRAAKIDPIVALRYE